MTKATNFDHFHTTQNVRWISEEAGKTSALEGFRTSSECFEQAPKLELKNPKMRLRDPFLLFQKFGLSFKTPRQVLPAYIFLGYMQLASIQHAACHARQFARQIGWQIRGLYLREQIKMPIKNRKKIFLNRKDDWHMKKIAQRWSVRLSWNWHLAMEMQNCRFPTEIERCDTRTGSYTQRARQNCKWRCSTRHRLGCSLSLRFSLRKRKILLASKKTDRARWTHKL